LRRPLARRRTPASISSAPAMRWHCQNDHEHPPLGERLGDDVHVVTRQDRERTLAQIRELCMALPGTSERLSHGSPTFFLLGKRAFVMVLDNHHGDGRFAIWCAAGAGVQGMLVEADAERFFVPPYVGYRGWLGVRLDRGLAWDEIAGVVEDAYAEVAPARLLAEAAKLGQTRPEHDRNS
jgi:hypothetical protein